MSLIYGLVVCGGQSSRMGTDKSLLDYHGQPQRYHLHKLLKSLCERVFISCNASQAPDIPAEYEVLVDEPEYAGIGPMGALLTAFKHHPNVAFVAIGCDYPLINTGHLQRIFEVLLKSKYASAYYNETTKLYEPLLAGYQQNIIPILNENFNLNNYSLQRALRESKAEVIVPETNMIIQSIDTRDEYEKLMIQLRSRENYNTK